MASPMARLQQKTQAAVTTGLAGSTGTPCAMAYGLYAFSPVSGLDSHRRPAKRLAELDPSVGRSGPRDFTVRVDALRRCACNASIASRATCRDDRDTPSERRETGETIGLICVSVKAKYFTIEVLTQIRKIRTSGKSVLAVRRTSRRLEKIAGAARDPLPGSPAYPIQFLLERSGCAALSGCPCLSSPRRRRLL
jgi:hypothetical protein